MIWTLLLQVRQKILEEGIMILFLLLWEVCPLISFLASGHGYTTKVFLWFANLRQQFLKNVGSCSTLKIEFSLCKPCIALQCLRLDNSEIELRLMFVLRTFRLVNVLTLALDKRGQVCLDSSMAGCYVPYFFFVDSAGFSTGKTTSKIHQEAQYLAQYVCLLLILINSHWFSQALL